VSRTVGGEAVADKQLDSLCCDLLVIGSGAGGLSAAVTAAHLGLDVLLVEKAARFGGTTAWSGGWMFVPRNPLALAAGIDEPVEEPLRYLRSILGDDAAASPRLHAFLAHGPAMVRFHLEHTVPRSLLGKRSGEGDGASADEAVLAFPHLVDRGKPGLIAVDRDGERFVDEAGSRLSPMRADARRAGDTVRHRRHRPRAHRRRVQRPRAPAATPSTAAARPPTTACRATPNTVAATPASRRSKTRRSTPCASCPAASARSQGWPATNTAACSMRPARRCRASMPPATTWPA